MSTPAETAPASESENKTPKTLGDWIEKVLENENEPLSARSLTKIINKNVEGQGKSYHESNVYTTASAKSDVIEKLDRAQLAELIGKDRVEESYPSSGKGRRPKAFFRLKPSHSETLKAAIKSANVFKERGFINQSSVLQMDSSLPLWTEEHFGEVIQILENVGGEGRTLLTKDLKVALDEGGASEEARQLLGELYLLYILPLRDVAKPEKRSGFEEITGGTQLPTHADELLNETGAFYRSENYGLTGVDNIRFLTQFGLKLSRLPVEKRHELLEPDKIEATLRGANFMGGLSKHPAMARALTSLFAPELFPPVIEQAELEHILSKYEKYLDRDELRGNQNLSDHRRVGLIRELVRAENRKKEFEFEQTPANSKEEVVRVFEFTKKHADDLNVSQDWLNTVSDLLSTRKQIIFDGPPGTGKTFLAEKIAQEFTGSEDNYRLVQFHPSYGYEDFFEGYRPRKSSDSGALSMELVPGPLRKMVELAKEKDEEPVVLIIDEMNRGNLPRIFGELYYSLEYRDGDVDLMYSPDEQFTLPDNLYIIGTMNSADRSITEVDAALRRRFAIIPLNPLESPTKDILANWTSKRSLYPKLAEIWAELNTALQERSVSVDQLLGPSYFIGAEPQSASDMETIWKYQITPQLRSLFPGDPKSVEALSFDAIRTRVLQPGKKTT